MALQIPLSTEFGLSVDDAYARISMITTLHEAEDIHEITIDVFMNKTTFDAGNKPLSRFILRRPYDDTASVGFADIYAWLKTQPGFENATDV